MEINMMAKFTTKIFKDGFHQTLDMVRRTMALRAVDLQAEVERTMKTKSMCGDNRLI